MPSNKDLISSLQRNGRLSSHKVAEAMEQIDRALFVPAGEPPYMDHPVPIGYNVTISAPHMHAICLELLKDHLQPGMHALDVGAGLCVCVWAFQISVASNVFSNPDLRYLVLISASGQCRHRILDCRLCSPGWRHWPFRWSGTHS